MINIRSWPVWSKFLVGALVLYSALLCAVSFTTLVQALRRHWTLQPHDVILQSLMTLFLPALLIGLSRARLASGILFAGVAINLALLLFDQPGKSDVANTLSIESVLFLGLPMLGAAILFHRLSRRRPPNRNEE